MTTIKDFLSEEKRTFDEKFPTIDGMLLGDVEMTGDRSGHAFAPTADQLKDFLKASHRRLLQRVVSMVEEKRIVIADNWAFSHDRDDERFSSEDKAYNKALGTIINLLKEDI